MVQVKHSWVVILQGEIMSYINTETLQYPVSEREIRALFPNTSFPAIFAPPEGYALVFDAPQPEFDATEFIAVQDTPILTEKGHYEQQWRLEALPPETVTQLKQARYDQAMQAIDAQIQAKIREKYALEDEQYFARIGVCVALGVYEFQEGEREALLEFGQFVESIRQWGRDERAKLAL